MGVQRLIDKPVRPITPPSDFTTAARSFDRVEDDEQLQVDGFPSHGLSTCMLIEHNLRNNNLFEALVGNPT
jgi:hypothetical protein